MSANWGQAALAANVPGLLLSADSIEKLFSGPCSKICGPLEPF
jgi:hypothetical protein